MKVICIKQHSQGILKVGRIYEVYDISTCRCGQIDFSIGIMDSCGTICKCGCETEAGVWWINSKLFARLEEKGQMFIEEFIELEELI